MGACGSESGGTGSGSAGNVESGSSGAVGVFRLASVTNFGERVITDPPVV
jgi:hypothetical protein